MSWAVGAAGCAGKQRGAGARPGLPPGSRKSGIRAGASRLTCPRTSEINRIKTR